MAEDDILEAEYIEVEEAETLTTTSEQSQENIDELDLSDKEISLKLLPVIEHLYEKKFTCVIYSDGVVAVSQEGIEENPNAMTLIREGVKRELGKSCIPTVREAQEVMTLYSDQIIDRPGTVERTELEHAAQITFKDIVSAGVKHGATDIHLFLRSKLTVSYRVNKKVRTDIGQVIHKRDVGDAIFNVVINSLGAKNAGGESLNSTSFQSTTFQMEVQDHNGESKTVDLRIEKAPLEDEAEESNSMFIRLSQSSKPKSLEQLNVETSLANQIKRVMKLGQGMLLVTGATGSGKTTLLHAALLELPEDKSGRTVEDPVELKTTHPQISQVSKPKEEWPDALRSMLRQDPDAIMIGELRDGDAARIYVQATRTGHLALATLHTTSAIGTIGRLLDLGVEPVDLSESGILELVVASRLSSKTCQKCALTHEGLDEEKLALVKKLSPAKYKNMRFVNKHATNCRCDNGISGMIGLAEYIVGDDDIREFIRNNEIHKIEPHIRSQGWKSLADIALEKVEAGILDPFNIKDEVADLFTTGRTTTNYTYLYRGEV